MSQCLTSREAHHQRRLHLMKLAIWNCNMAFDRKHPALMNLKPDVAIVLECANLEVLRTKAPDFRPSDAVWVGENKNKGLAVFAFNGFKLNLAPEHDPSLKYILPIEVSDPIEFDLLMSR
jgi:exodeoxyribonuclease-3